jgi:hypothetical protein
MHRGERSKGSAKGWSHLKPIFVRKLNHAEEQHVHLADQISPSPRWKKKFSIFFFESEKRKLQAIYSALTAGQASNR